MIWTRSALRDLESIRTYIRQFNPLAAQRMASRLLNAAEALRDQPGQGRTISGGRRELVIIRPYLIRYMVEGDTALILRVRHGARRLG